jgi:ATP-dependent RNA helicase DDX49/DBP8
MLYRKVTQASRCCRSLEVIVQAHWVDCYDNRVPSVAEENPRLSLTKHRMTVLKDPCEDFGWTEKDLPNKMAVWRGYHGTERTRGWAPLVFAGMGLYQYCKNRVDFTPDALGQLKEMCSVFEAAVGYVTSATAAIAISCRPANKHGLHRTTSCFDC